MPRMKRLLVAVAAVVSLSLFGLVTLFADNLKMLYGCSADALAGSTAVTLRSRAYVPSGVDPAVPAPHRTVDTRDDRFSTFAIDVDTASYSYMRAQVRYGRRPEPKSIRVEEWVNAFDYRLPEPQGTPFSVQVDGAVSPFDETKTLLRVALQGRHVTSAARKPAHLVFLVDVSGSMSTPDKLPLAQRALRFLAAQLREDDTVALVTYAG